MDELIENEAVTEPIEDTIATDEQEATAAPRVRPRGMVDHAPMR